MNLETKITIYKFTPQLFTLTRKGLFQVPSFSDPLGVFTVAVYIFDL